MTRNYSKTKLRDNWSKSNHSQIKLNALIAPSFVFSPNYLRFFAKTADIPSVQFNVPWIMHLNCTQDKTTERHTPEHITRSLVDATSTPLQDKQYYFRSSTNLFFFSSNFFISLGSKAQQSVGNYKSNNSNKKNERKRQLRRRWVAKFETWDIHKEVAEEHFHPSLVTITYSHEGRSGVCRGDQSKFSKNESKMSKPSSILPRALWRADLRRNRARRSSRPGRCRSGTCG